ncbi:MAG: hypothetical protein AVDCRST_MAG77-146, partial [uncultured Chloroflexi bacterium]
AAVPGVGGLPPSHPCRRHGSVAEPLPALHGVGGCARGRAHRACKHLRRIHIAPGSPHGARTRSTGDPL